MFFIIPAIKLLRFLYLQASSKQLVNTVNSRKDIVVLIAYLLSVWIAFSIPHVFIVMPMDKFVFYALAYLMPVIAFHSHWIRLFFAHILAAVWIHPAILFNRDHLLNELEQYEFLSKIQSSGGDVLALEK